MFSQMASDLGKFKAGANANQFAHKSPKKCGNKNRVSHPFLGILFLQGHQRRRSVPDAGWLRGAKQNVNIDIEKWGPLPAETGGEGLLGRWAPSSSSFFFFGTLSVGRIGLAGAPFSCDIGSLSPPTRLILSFPSSFPLVSWVREVCWHPSLSQLAHNLW